MPAGAEPVCQFPKIVSKAVCVWALPALLHLVRGSKSRGGIVSRGLRCSCPPGGTCFPAQVTWQGSNLGIRAVPFGPPPPPPWTCDLAELGAQVDLPGGVSGLRRAPVLFGSTQSAEPVAPPSETGSVLSSDTRVGASGCVQTSLQFLPGLCAV